MPVQQARARDRQRKILHAAAAVFAKRGFCEAGMDEIARASGTSKGGLYFHFPGKEAVLLALLDQTASLLRSKVERAIVTETDPVSAAEAALSVLLRTLTKHRALARVFAVEAMGAGSSFNARALEIQDEFADMIRLQLDAAIAQGVIEPIDTTIAAQAWIGTLHGLITRWVTASGRERRPIDESYETIRLMLLRSVGAVTADAAPHSRNGNGQRQ